MKKFVYNMENLLSVKQKLEEQAKIAYGNARAVLTREENKLNSLFIKKSSYEEELRAMQKDKLNLREIIRTGEAIEIMKELIEQQKIVVKNAEKRVEAARIRLNDAMVERKIQDKLKEKAWEEYLLLFEAEERKEVDELTSYQYSNPITAKEDN